MLPATIRDFKVSQKAQAHVPRFPQLDGCLVSVRVTFSVENVLRRSLLPGPLDYYYFGTLCGTMGPVENLFPPRNVFFLRKQQGHWTAIEDYWMNRIPVRGGRHSDNLGRGKSGEDAIPEILLTPETDTQPRLLLCRFSDEGNNATVLLGAAGARRLIVPLLNHPDLNVRAEACIALERDSGPWSCTGPALPTGLDRLAAGGLLVSVTCFSISTFLRATQTPPFKIVLHACWGWPGYV